MTTPHTTGAFLLKVTAAHVVTYLLVGIIAAALLDYERIFEMPVIRDFMKPFGSTAVFVGPVVQTLRGLILAAVLLPFRPLLAGRRGWLWLWLLIVGIGIVSTPAAAPGSAEGVVYSRLPLWYHLLGLPEILIQTLLFSALAALVARHPVGTLAALPPVVRRTVRAVAVACFAFIGYAVVSVVFALVAGARIDATTNFSLATQGMFLFPLTVNAILAFVAADGLTARRRALAAAASYALGAVGIAFYQAFVFGSVGIAYAVIAPVLPAAIVWLLIPHADAADPTVAPHGSAATRR